jgi:hypothetical protein
MSRDLKAVMEVGIEPENDLDQRVRVWRLEREEMEGGIAP